MRKTAMLLILFIILATSQLSFGANEININLPATSTLSAQTMMVGVTSTIRIELTCENSLNAFKIPIELNSESGQRLFNTIPGDDVNFALSNNILRTRASLIDSRNDLPDTIQFWALYIPGQGQAMAPNHYLIATIDITPTETGVMHLSEVLNQMDSAYFHETNGAIIIPEFIAPDIIILDGDCNNNGITDNMDINNNPNLDCNDNNIIDSCEIASGSLADCNNNFIPDECDLANGYSEDCNSNGIPDECELDCNSNGLVDECETVADCNCNNLADSEEIAQGFVLDTDLDGIPDECQSWTDNLVYMYVPQTIYHDPQEMIVGYPEEIKVMISNTDYLRGFKINLQISSTDSDRRWVTLTPSDFNYEPLDIDNITLQDAYLKQNSLWPDSVFMSLLSFDDTLSPGTYVYATITVMPTKAGLVSLTNIEEPYSNPDSTLFISTTGNISPQFYAPDITIIELPDCNENGIADIVEIDEGLAEDCNNNGIPDECDLTSGYSVDCNDNGIIDECDIISGYSEDCNSNNIPDECDPDCNFNFIPDDCELITDCNCNRIDDANDILSGWSTDNNSNSIPDDCEGLTETQLRFYVPREFSHADQQLLIDQPSYIYVNFINSDIVYGINITLLLSALNNATIFNEITEANVEYLLPEDILNMRAFSVNYHDQIWPDTFAITMLRFDDNSLPSGSRPILRIKVTPVEFGTVQLDDVYISEFDMYVSYYDDQMDRHSMDFVGEDIIITGVCCLGTRGNFDNDQFDYIDISDLLMMVDYMFLTPSGPGPWCYAEGDFNGSGQIDISDLLELVDYMFLFPPGATPALCE